jgi:putative redox protein
MRPAVQVPAHAAGRLSFINARSGPARGRQQGKTKGAQMECTVHWAPDVGMGFVAETGSGHLLTMDGAPDGGGRNLAPRPMETLLAGAGACTAYDVVLILKRGRHDVRGCRVKLEADRAESDPKVFTRLRMHFVVSARAVPEAVVERAVALSRDKYCSAMAMLAKTAEIETSFEVVEV